MSDYNKSVESLVLSGHEINYGRLTICNLSKYSMSRKVLDRKWQVICTDKRFPFQEIYTNPSVAVDKFCLIKNVIDGKYLKDKENCLD